MWALQQCLCFFPCMFLFFPLFGLSIYTCLFSRLLIPVFDTCRSVRSIVGGPIPLDIWPSQQEGGVGNSHWRAQRPPSTAAQNVGTARNRIFVFAKCSLTKKKIYNTMYDFNLPVKYYDKVLLKDQYCSHMSVTLAIWGNIIISSDMSIIDIKWEVNKALLNNLIKLSTSDDGMLKCVINESFTECCFTNQLNDQ